jgi:hypothetical protein
MTRIIEIVISPDGQTKLETKGFGGQSCRDASRFLEQALGVRASEQLTAEFHERSAVAQSHHQQS